MNFLESLNESLAYIESHLEDEIDIEKAAAIACCSPYHYQRMFSCMADMTVGEYIRRRRLSLAAIHLLQGEEKVIDVALRYGYQSPTAFTRAFINMHGVTPSMAKKQQVSLKLFPPISFQISIKGENAMKYRIEEKAAKRLVGIKEEISTIGGQNFIQVPGVWKKAGENGLCYKIMAEADSGSKDMFGVCANFRENAFDYYIAVESSKEVPEGMECLTLNAGTWVVFECEGVSGIQDTFKRVYSEWFPGSGYEHAGTAEIEYYPGESQKVGPNEMTCEVWIPIVKKNK